MADPRDTHTRMSKAENWAKQAGESLLDGRMTLIF